MKIITTSIKENKFFEEKEIKMGNLPESHENSIINVFDEIKYQSIIGFGGAFTDSSAYNYSLMSDKNKELVIKAYFDKNDGIAYNFGRTHINACDFAIEPYTYVQDGDKTLDSFDIGYDKKHILPFLKDALKCTKDGIMLFASPWSPPAYMKDNKSVFKGGKLLDEYKDTWARYYAKYIKAMKAQGVEISAISVQNEPLAIQSWESCQYTPEEEAEFAEKYLIPALDGEGLSDIKIIIWDHNKERVYDRAKKILKAPLLKKRVWGVGHHWYSGDHFDGLRLVHEALGKEVLCTEFCSGIYEDPIYIAERYAREMCENLNNFMSASCDWNLILDTNGGPFHNRTSGKKPTDPEFDPKDGGCAAPILYDVENDKVILTPCYYYIGHFSKYIEKGAKRIATTKYTDDLNVCAFENPNGEKIVIILNSTNNIREAVIRHNDVCTRIEIGAHTITTIIF
ncbi:MAG: glucosylceramidase [Clostridia bacterium]|nr:glucosylceramidase [Clostridia bacterium]